MNQLAKWSSNFNKPVVSHLVNNSSSLCSIEVLMTAFQISSQFMPTNKTGPTSLKRRTLNFLRFIPILFPITAQLFTNVSSIHFLDQHSVSTSNFCCNCYMFLLNTLIDYIILNIFIGDRRSKVVKVLCYEREGRWFDPSC